MFRSIDSILLIVLVCSGTGPGIATAQPAPQPVNPDGVHIVLLAATDKTSATRQRELPPGVAKALKDASQFLPFTYYDVLDQVSLRGGGVTQKMRLRGLAGAQEYQLTLGIRPSADARDRVTVTLSLVETMIRDGGRTSDVMTTQYGARIGETVVVGTSQLQSDISIVLLMTVLPPRAK
jgi:hypothetical protein